MTKVLVTVVCFLTFFFNHLLCFGEEWFEEKTKHFIVLYQNKEDRGLASATSRKAEGYVQKFSDQIGYLHAKKFWTWEDRVRIILYADKDIFQQRAGQPNWARGAAAHIELLNNHVILSYPQEDIFLEEVLPHEIGHLILHDFVGLNRAIPKWFDEGVAQLFEKDTRKKADATMRVYVRLKTYIPLTQLNVIDIRKVSNADEVGLFYAQSASVVDFLTREFGQSAFQRICRGLRDGQDILRAITLASKQAIQSWEDLERRWISFLNR